MKATSRFEHVPIDRLVPYARNARTHSKEQILQLRSSLREFGFVNPVIVDKDLNIIAGHGRVAAAKAEGLTEVPCVFAEHLTDAQKRAYILADNRLALSAGWDEELLALEFGELRDLGFDLELTGFDVKEIEKLFAGDGGDVEDDNFDLTAALEEAAFVLPGDVWTLGRHRLICGDATDAATVKALMDGRKANLILTDPP
ncbi:MAG: ParB/Srx family N-terminal domain-containing protein, partial [Eubacteriales bacterium]|nr:ParB/Srx family N-terminal domain-containing protein [Eubacteriales bacterium]